MRNTDNLSASEPATLGRGMRTKYPRRLTSDSNDDDELRDIRGHTNGRLPIDENIPPPPQQLFQEIKQELAYQRKKFDFISEEMVWVKTNIQDIKATQADNRRALQAVSFVSKEKPPLLQLPLRTAEAYKDFLTKIGSDNDLAQETAKHLSTVGGRTEKEFIRNLLTALLGPPLAKVSVGGENVSSPKMNDNNEDANGSYEPLPSRAPLRKRTRKAVKFRHLHALLEDSGIRSQLRLASTLTLKQYCAAKRLKRPLGNYVTTTMRCQTRQKTMRDIWQETDIHLRNRQLN
nr:unnamed protein product [Spirometra erinaceieuropaei]